MKTATLRYFDEDDEIAFAKLALNQRIIVGSTGIADVCLQYAEGVAEEHCEMILASSGFHVRSLASGNLFLVNKEARAVVLLTEDSEIQIGRNRMYVEISFTPTVVEDDFESSDEEVDPLDDFIPPSPTVLTNGIVAFEIPLDDSNMEALQQKVIQDRKSFLALNLKSLGENPDDHDLDDLFADIAELNSDHSMSLIGPSSAGEILERISEYSDRDCGVILIPKNPDISSEGFLKSARLFLAWLLKPSLFDFNMRNGNDFVPKQIFETVELAIYFSTGNESWNILTRNEKIQQFSDILSD